VGITTSPNKELKLTKPGTIGASQLNSSVRPTQRCEGAGLRDRSGLAEVREER
jgi:hypothetical protein